MASRSWAARSRGSSDAHVDSLLPAPRRAGGARGDARRVRLRPRFTVWNRQATPMVHTLIHPYAGLSGPGCSSQNDDTLGGGAFDFNVAKNGGQEFRFAPGCYVLFVRWQGQPGHVQVAANLGV